LANAVIVDVEATPTRISKEVDATETMLERTVARFALAPGSLAADVAYGTGAMLGWLVERGIDPHIPVWDQSEVSANGKFSRADFTYDKPRDLYTCPAGKELKTSGTAHDGTTIKYFAKRSDCAVCPLKRHCTTGLERRISRDVHQDARDYAQALMQTEAYRVSRSARKKIETLFGEAKHNLALVRLRLRGLSGARDEFLLTAAVQNLKRLVVHATRPPPQPMTA
jgi:Transposase DDE domain